MQSVVSLFVAFYVWGSPWEIRRAFTVHLLHVLFCLAYPCSLLLPCLCEVEIEIKKCWLLCTLTFDNYQVFHKALSKIFGILF